MDKLTDEEKVEHKEILDDIDQYAGLVSLKDTDGGKTLIKGLQDDVVSHLYMATADCTTLSHTELIGLCLEIKTKLGLLMVITRSTQNKKDAESVLNDVIDSAK